MATARPAVMRPANVASEPSSVANVEAAITTTSVQNTILEVLEGHTELLGKINRAVQRQDSDEADSLGELLRQIAANGVAHTEGLRRVEVQLAAIAEALSGE